MQVPSSHHRLSKLTASSRKISTYLLVVGGRYGRKELALQTLIATHAIRWTVAKTCSYDVWQPFSRTTAMKLVSAPCCWISEASTQALSGL